MKKKSRRNDERGLIGGKNWCRASIRIPVEFLLQRIKQFFRQDRTKGNGIIYMSVRQSLGGSSIRHIISATGEIYFWRGGDYLTKKATVSTWVRGRAAMSRTHTRELGKKWNLGCMEHESGNIYGTHEPCKHRTTIAAIGWVVLNRAMNSYLAKILFDRGGRLYL